MSTTQERCKRCGRPLSQDEQMNFFSFCYDCFRDLKDSELRKSTAMRVIGILGVIFVSMFIFTFSSVFGIFYGYARPLRIVAFLIGSTIAELIPILLIVFGTNLKRKWSTIFKAKPIEPQRVLSTPPIHTISTQKRFCPECGTKLSDQTQNFCVNCGAEIRNI
ncbi:MAG: zinc ribbon domain-containing protein [Promethearchaeota archaeon]